MKNIIVVFGGKSVEHDISILTAVTAMKNISADKYNLYPVYLTKENNFVLIKNAFIKDSYNNIKKHKKVHFGIKKQHAKIGTKLVEVDCVINCCHGGFGENGGLEEYFKFCEIPCSSSGIYGASICMDKALQKDIFRANDINCIPFVTLYKNRYKTDEQTIEYILKDLDFPLIVKPATLGSSIGIQKCGNSEELKAALEVAFCFDCKVVVEKYLPQMREINIAILGYENEIILSALEEPQSLQTFLDFDDKYSLNTTAIKTLDPKVNDAQSTIIKNSALKAFKMLNLCGVVRFDFMISKDGEVFLNEINTNPGSLAYYLFKTKDLEFFEIIDSLIACAETKQKNYNNNFYEFKSSVLDNLDSLSGKMKN